MSANWCDSCNREIGEYDGALCGACADDRAERERVCFCGCDPE